VLWLDVAASAASQQLLEDMPTHPAGVQSPDSALVAQAASGDERALGELYDRYGGMSYSLTCSIVGEHADAEEVVADAFAQVWRTAAGFDPARGSVTAWLATIVRTRALDLVRSRKRRARVLEEAAVVTDEGETLVLAPTLESPDRGAELTETSAIVRRSLAELPPPQRRVIELAYFGGLSQSEIAAQLSEPLGTVKTRMRAGMEKLRQALRPVLEAGA
jgi:RNA polymerase sigma-70 factor, ECF subfamily